MAWGGERTGQWHWRNGLIEPSRSVIFDIDGVLSDAVGRQHFLEFGRRDWFAFFEACGDDGDIEEVATLLRLLDPSLQIILLTGRPSRVAPQTLAWLERYGLRWDVLIMRDWGENNVAAQFKCDVVDDLRRFGFDLQLALDDDPANHAMYVAEGVPCIYIHSGYYD